MLFLNSFQGPESRILNSHYSFQALYLSTLPAFLLSDLQVNVMESFYCNANSLSFGFQLISTTQTGYSSHLGKKNLFKSLEEKLTISIIMKDPVLVLDMVPSRGIFKGYLAEHGLCHLLT